MNRYSWLARFPPRENQSTPHQRRLEKISGSNGVQVESVFSGSLPQQGSVLLQPTLCDLVVGTNAFDLAPESRRVIHLPQMHQLMENDVILHVQRRLDQPPVQRNRPAPRTRTPTRFLIAHGDATDGDLMLRCVGLNSWQQFPGGEPPQMLFNRRTKIRHAICHLHHFRSEANRVSRHVCGDFNHHTFAAKQDGCSHCPQP